MRACKHFKSSLGETHILPSNGLPWNGWLVVYEGDREILSSFKAGLMWDFLEHLAESDDCLNEVEPDPYSQVVILRLLKDIRQLWGELVLGTPPPKRYDFFTGDSPYFRAVFKKD